MRAASIVATVAAAGVFGAGCGGGGFSAAGPYPESPDALCAEVAELFEERQADPPRSFDEAAELAEDLVDLADRAQEGMRDGEPPVEHEDAYERYLDARERANELLREGQRAAEDRDGIAYREAQEEARETQPRRHRRALEAGLSECSRSGAGP